MIPGGGDKEFYDSIPKGDPSQYTNTKVDDDSKTFTSTDKETSNNNNVEG